MTPKRPPIGRPALELAERLAISLEEPVQQQPAVWIRQRLEDLVVHAGDNR